MEEAFSGRSRSRGRCCLLAAACCGRSRPPGPADAENSRWRPRDQRTPPAFHRPAADGGGGPVAASRKSKTATACPPPEVGRGTLGACPRSGGGGGDARRLSPRVVPLGGGSRNQGAEGRRQGRRLGRRLGQEGRRRVQQGRRPEQQGRRQGQLGRAGEGEHNDRRNSRRNRIPARSWSIQLFQQLKRNIL